MGRKALEKRRLVKILTKMDDESDEDHNKVHIIELTDNDDYYLCGLGKQAPISSEETKKPITCERCIMLAQIYANTLKADGLLQDVDTKKMIAVDQA